MVVYKKLRNQVIAELVIPESARRTATPIGRKCRAEFAVVSALTTEAGAPVLEGVSLHDPTFKYVVGEKVTPDAYNDDFRQECTSGIHFFLTRQEAVEYV